MKTINLICPKCHKPFSKCLSEYNRRKTKGYTNFYCSPFCFHSDLDELAPFRQVFYQARQGSKIRDIKFSITLEDLKRKWDEQNGICPYTKLKMEIPTKFRDTISSFYSNHFFL